MNQGGLLDGCCKWEKVERKEFVGCDLLRVFAMRDAIDPVSSGHARL